MKEIAATNKPLAEHNRRKNYELRNSTFIHKTRIVRVLPD
jgi:hypothetical protein